MAAPGVDVEVVVGDLGRGDGVDELIAALGDREVGVLVNNAGFGTHGRVAEIDANGSTSSSRSTSMRWCG